MTEVEHVLQLVLVCHPVYVTLQQIHETPAEPVYLAHHRLVVLERVLLGLREERKT